MKEHALLRSRWLVAAIIIALPLILYGRFALGGRALFWGTPLLQFWPWRHLAGEQLRAGQLPLWNPYAGTGVPLLADHQTAVLYPLNLIFWLWPLEGAAVARAMGVSLLLHAVLGGAAMAALARELGVSRLGALVAALALMLSGYNISRASFLTEISALPWIPLLWLATRRAVNRQRAIDVTGLAAVIALQFLAGHAQTWFYAMCTAALYGLWEAWRQASRQDTPNAARRLAALWAHLWPLAAAAAWGLALAAAQFLPTLELSRAAGRAGQEGWETYALQYSLWPWRLITLLLPDFFGNPARGDYWGYATYWEDAGYVGVLPFAFAALAVIAWLHRARRREAAATLAAQTAPFWASLTLFSLLMALGKNTPFYMFFFRHVPGVSSFQAPARWLCIYTPAMALLAGIGADALRPSPRLTFACRLAVAGGISIALTSLAARALLPEVKATFFGPLIQFALLFAASMLLFLWGQDVRSGQALRLGRLRAWQAAVLLLVAVDLLLAGHHLNPATDAALYTPRTEIGAFLAADGPQGRIFITAAGRQEVMFGRYLDFGDYGPPDLAHWWGMREALLPDLPMVEHLSSANTFEPLVQERTQTLLQAVQGPLPSDPPEARPHIPASTLRALGAMNVAYILDPAPDLSSDAPLALERIYRSPAVYVYRNPYLVPRATVVYQARIVHSPGEALDLLLAPDFDPTRQVILEDHPSLPANVPSPALQPGTAPPGSALTRSAALLLPSTPNQVTIRAVLSRSGYLVLADATYAGWQAFVDGRQTPILQANYAFRAVALESGEHTVRFVYRPRSFVLGAVCSLLALAGAVAVCLWSARARRRRAVDKSNP